MGKQGSDTIYLHATYPHPMVEHLNKILPSLDKSDIDKFETKLVRRYKVVFPSEEQEIANIENMASKHLIAEFYRALDKSEKEKTDFLINAVQTLVPIMDEWNLLEVLESFMYIHEWKMEIYVPRKKKEKKPPKPVEKKVEKEPPKEEPKSEKKKIEKKKKIESPKKNIVKKLEESAKEEKKVPIPPKVEQEVPKEPPKPLFEELMSAEVRRFLTLAKEGRADAQYELGNFYATEDSEHLDYKEAEKWYLKASNQGNARSKFALARLYDSNKIQVKDNAKEALRYYFELAEEGYSTAQCAVGLKYRFGFGVKENVKEAEKWLLRASEQGDVNAQRHLADLYLYHNKNREAITWLKNASGKGDTHCERRLRRFTRKN